PLQFNYFGTSQNHHILIVATCEECLTLTVGPSVRKGLRGRKRLRGKPRSQKLTLPYRGCCGVGGCCGSVNGLHLLLHIIHQEVLPQGVGCREVSLASANFSDFLDKTDKVVIASQHKGVDQ